MDAGLVRRLVATEGRTERDVSVLLGISRPRLAAVLDGLGVDRGMRARQSCPLDAGELRALVEAGETGGALARRFAVTWDTAARWLAEAGLLPADPGIDPVRLRTLYVDQVLTTREVAVQFEVSKARVLRALAAAGIAARPRTYRRPRGARATLTDEALRGLFADPAMTVGRAAALVGVDVDYLRGRVHRLRLARPAGSFTPLLPDAELAELAGRGSLLYGQGRTLKQIATELGVSTQTVRLALHHARLPARAGGGDRVVVEAPRVLVDKLYADEQIRQVLREHQVHLPEAGSWRQAGPRESYAPLPLSAGLLKALYVDVGLAMSAIAMLCGVGVGAVRGGLLAHDIAVRPSRQASPWQQRHH